MKKLDRFTIVQRIGEGGGATVYKAEEQLPAGAKRMVTLRVFGTMAANDKAAEARFAKELRPLTTLDGLGHLAAFYGAGITDNTPWIATQQVEATLADSLGELPGPPEQIARLLEQVGTALAAMHGLTPPMLHNDITPQNILIVRGQWYCLGGLSLAAPAAEEPTRSVQSVPYGAPEAQSRELGQPCPSTDLYALGHLAYQWALGAKLHRQQFPGVFDERGGKEVPAQKWMGWHCSIGMAATPIVQVKKDFPANLSAVIAKLMTKPMEGRYASAHEMLMELRGGGATVSVAAPAGASLPPLPVNAPSQGEAAPAPPKGFIRTQRPSMLNRPAQSPAPPPVPVPPPVAPSAIKPTGTGAVYYVRLRDRKSGPFDFATLQRQAKQGMLSRLHQVSTDQVNWKPAGTVEGLFQ